MPAINIEPKREKEGAWMFGVQVEGENFRVTMQKEYWEKLTGGKEPPERLVERSFAFLLERESVDAILKQFDLSLIQTYFHEYEETIGK